LHNFNSSALQPYLYNDDRRNIMTVTICCWAMPAENCSEHYNSTYFHLLFRTMSSEKPNFLKKLSAELSAWTTTASYLPTTDTSFTCCQNTTHMYYLQHVSEAAAVAANSYSETIFTGNVTYINIHLACCTYSEQTNTNRQQIFSNSALPISSSHSDQRQMNHTITRLTVYDISHSPISQLTQTNHGDQNLHFNVFQEN